MFFFYYISFCHIHYSFMVWMCVLFFSSYIYQLEPTFSKNKSNIFWNEVWCLCNKWYHTLPVSDIIYFFSSCYFYIYFFFLKILFEHDAFIIYMVIKKETVRNEKRILFITWAWILYQPDRFFWDRSFEKNPMKRFQKDARAITQLVWIKMICIFRKIFGGWHSSCEYMKMICILVNFLEGFTLSLVVSRKNLFSPFLQYRNPNYLPFQKGMIDN